MSQHTQAADPWVKCKEIYFHYLASWGIPKAIPQQRHTSEDAGTAKLSPWQITSLLFTHDFIQSLHRRSFYHHTVILTVLLWSLQHLLKHIWQGASKSTKHLCYLYSHVLLAKHTEHKQHEMQSICFPTLLLPRYYAFPDARSPECIYSSCQSSVLIPSYLPIFCSQPIPPNRHPRWLSLWHFAVVWSRYRVATLNNFLLCIYTY